MRKRTNRSSRASEDRSEFPKGTLIFYGPDDRRATKVVAAIIERPGGDVAAIQKWIADEGDVRNDEVIQGELAAFMDTHGARAVVTFDRIVGCPHEEGSDYPEGAACPRCPFWAIRDRWSGEIEN